MASWKNSSSFSSCSALTWITILKMVIEVITANASHTIWWLKLKYESNVSLENQNGYKQNIYSLWWLWRLKCTEVQSQQLSLKVHWATILRFLTTLSIFTMVIVTFCLSSATYLARVLGVWGVTIVTRGFSFNTSSPAARRRLQVSLLPAFGARALRNQGGVTSIRSPRKKASATPFYRPLLPNSEREVFLIRSMMKYAIEKYFYLYNSACAIIDKYLLSTNLHSSLCSERCSFWHCALQ